MACGASGRRSNVPAAWHLEFARVPTLSFTPARHQLLRLRRHCLPDQGQLPCGHCVAWLHFLAQAHAELMLSHRPCNLASVLIWLNFAPEFLGSGSASALRCVTFSKDSTGAEPLQLSWQRILRGLRLSHSDAASRPGMGLVSPSCCASRIALPSSRSFRLLCENAKKTNTLLPTSSCDVLRSVAGDPQPGSIDSSCPCRRIRADHDAAAYGGFRKRNRGSSSSLTRRRRPPKLATAHFSAWGRGTRPRCLRLV